MYGFKKKTRLKLPGRIGDAFTSRHNALGGEDTEGGVDSDGGMENDGGTDEDKGVES